MSKTITSISRPPLTGHPKRLSLEMARYHKRSLAPRDLTSEPRGCNSSFKSALAGAGLSEAQGSDGVVVLVRRAAKWGAALYDIVSSTQGSVTVQVGENRWTVPRIGPATAVASPQGWLNALGAALLARDKTSIETLGRVEYQPPEQHNLQYAAHTVPVIRSFGAYARGDGELATTRRAQEIALEQSASPARQALTLGPLSMLSALQTNDSAGFQTATVEALQWYRDYIVADEWAHAHEKLLPWLLLGLAARAHDRGWTVEVSSDYYPHWLVAGQPQPA